MLRRCHGFGIIGRRSMKRARDASFSKQTFSPTEPTEVSFAALGLSQPLLNGLAAQNLEKPTQVQSSVIPRLLSGDNIVISAGTGSGKTLAYALPIIQNLKLEEAQGYKRLPQRPRCLVLVPTRELASQVLDEVKNLSHFAKISSCCILGGEPYNVQKKSLSGQVDIVVASPGRLVQHEKLKHLKLQEISRIVIDEVDTMLTQGFGGDIRYILQKCFNMRQRQKQLHGESREENSRSSDPQLIMASATMTKAVKTLLNDVDGFTTEFKEYTQPDNDNLQSQKKPGHRVFMETAEIAGVHCISDHVTHNLIRTDGLDKMNVLDDILRETNGKAKKTMVFCNTVKSCRAVAYYLDNHFSRPTISYHGALSSKERAKNMEAFRAKNSDDPLFMVCTDIAARGLDIPGVDHVILFDFPLNPIDYLHRAGRTGRLGQNEDNSQPRNDRVSSIISKRDEVLARAIEGAIARKLPLDSLTSDKRHYQPGGKLAGVVGRVNKSANSRKRVSSKGLLKRGSNKRIVSDPNRPGIQVKQPSRKITSRTISKRIAELNQKRGEMMTRKRKKNEERANKS